MSRPVPVKDQIAFVNGANRGIGKQFVEALLAAGAVKVYAGVRDPKSAQPLVDQYGDRVVPIPFDLGDAGTIEAAAKAASDAQIVINTAGGFRSSSALADESFDNLQFELDKNVYGLLRTAKAFAPVLKKNGGGAFVQLNSVVSVKAFPDFATYSASKAAAYSLTQSLKRQLAEQGTAVFSVHPGPIATDMGDDAGLTDVAEPASVVSDALLEAFRTGEFHVYAGSMAREVGSVYRPFAENVVEADLSEA